jgi:APA family basic amino acid/polyamine antiporter
MALVVGNMIGSGVFLLPAGLAPYGWSALGGWAVTIAGTMCLAACFAALAGVLPRAGGVHAYVEAAFGRNAGFLVAWSYWIGLWVGNAALAVAVVASLSAVVPALGQVPGAGATTAVGMLWLVTAINMGGARLAARVAETTVLLKLVPLLAVLLIAVVVLGRDGAAAVATPPTAMTLPGVTGSIALALWAMLGFESATIPADKVRNPKRIIPQATLLGTGLTGVIYLLISMAMLALVPANALAHSDAPFADFVRPFIGGVAAQVIALFAAIAAFGALNGWMLVVGELPRAMANAGVFPRWFARVSARGVPMPAILLAAALDTVLVLANYTKGMGAIFQFVILVSTTAMLVAYVACAAAVLVMRRRGQGRGEMLGARAMGPVAAAALVYACYAIFAAGQGPDGLAPLLWGLGLLLAGLPVLVLMRR